MAKIYLEQLSQMVAELMPLQDPNISLECKHFFSGAALYADGKICGTLSPAGFALKLPEGLRFGLIKEGKANEFRFFPKGPIKREYVVLSKFLIEDKPFLKEILNSSINYIVEMDNPSAH